MRTGLPEIEWIYCLDIDVERLIYTAQVAINGFWERKRFSLLPELETPGDPTVIVFPNFEFATIPAFWDRVATLKHTIPMTIPVKLKQEVALFIPHQPFSLDELQDQWQKKNADFMKWLTENFPGLKRQIQTIEIRMSSYGSIASYEPFDENKSHTLYLYLRQDADVGNIAEMIISACLQSCKQGHLYSWEEFEAVVDIVMTGTRLKKLFPNFKPTLLNLRRHRGEQLRKSKSYMQSHGIPVLEKTLQWQWGRLIVNGHKADDITLRENKLVKLLSDKGERITSFDEVEDVLWGEDMYVSLAAVNKAMQRLRKKLVQYGLPKSSLQTIRKRGYVLHT